MSHSTSAPLFSQRTLATSGLFAPPLRVSLVKRSVLSSMPAAFWVRVAAPLMPLVALVELPPQNDDLSINTVLPPFSTTVLQADTPASPPPTTTTWSVGKLHAMGSNFTIRSLASQT